jgi:UDP-glucuronate decarboxylase
MSKLQHERLLEEAVASLSGLAKSLNGASILVTGASGFLAASLLIFLDRLSRFHNVSIELAASARRPANEVQLFSFLGSQSPKQWQLSTVENTDIPKGSHWIIVHTASYGAPADYMREPLATYRANTFGLSGLFEKATLENCERIAYFSTAEVYGQPPDEHIPTKENFLGGPDLSDPRSIYGESKRMAEVLGITLSKSKNIPFVVLRPWNIYGPGQRRHDGRVPMEFMRQLTDDGKISLLSDGSPRRSFCHIWEAMPQILACLRHPDAIGKAYNIGRQSDEISILELARACAQTAGMSHKLVNFNSTNRAAGMQRCQPETSQINILLNGKNYPVVLKDGLETCREWLYFLKNQS